MIDLMDVVFGIYTTIAALIIGIGLVSISRMSIFETILCAVFWPIIIPGSIALTLWEVWRDGR